MADLVVFREGLSTWLENVFILIIEQVQCQPRGKRQEEITDTIFRHVILLSLIRVQTETLYPKQSQKILKMHLSADEMLRSFFHLWEITTRIFPTYQLVNPMTQLVFSNQNPSGRHTVSDVSA